MDNRDWLILHTLFHEKNITKTGKILFIAQPTLTKRLKQIETELGVKIVDRGIKGVQFTPQGEYSWPDQKHLLFEEELCIASKHPIHLDDLPHLPRIDYRTDQLYKQLVENWWTEHYSEPPYIAMSVDQGDTCKEMVLNGLGYAIMPSLFLRDVEDIHKIHLKDKEGKKITQKTWMFYYNESAELNVVRAFVDFIKELDVYHL
ncbi:LysR family transcriptional regulator [Priestia endophytica]|uniref:LysR family transcriptional regulator n=1 Tax=Priestia endophytica TaxID=135735 RepID=UPI0020406457|nr:LysR family transcriptional regulator [Priestia endophytica]MCM3538195.1 LysR family transcriptional regulator [Priestia endophytica]